MVIPTAITRFPPLLLGTRILVFAGITSLQRCCGPGGRATFRGAVLIQAIAIGLSAAVYGHFQTRLAQTQLARERAEKLASEARFASLSSRLQPHFLFNTLNSISSLIRSDPPRAERVLGKFATLLRASLDAPADELVALQGEMKLVADYLEIQHTRYAQRLRYTLSVPDALLAHRVPPFSVQTLVENSIKYAVAPSQTGSRVEVVAQPLQDGRLRIEVWDDGPGFTEAQIPSNHGIDSLRQRLRSLYGEAGRLAVDRELLRTRVAIELPISEVAVA